MRKQLGKENFRGMTAGITLRAVAYHDHGNGLITLEFPVQEFSESHRRMLRELFPNLEHKAHELLTSETLLAAINPTIDVLDNEPAEDKW